MVLVLCEVPLPCVLDEVFPTVAPLLVVVPELLPVVLVVELFEPVVLLEEMLPLAVLEVLLPSVRLALLPAVTEALLPVVTEELTVVEKLSLQPLVVECEYPSSRARAFLMVSVLDLLPEKVKVFEPPPDTSKLTSISTSRLRTLPAILPKPGMKPSRSPILAFPPAFHMVSSVVLFSILVVHVMLVEFSLV